MLSGYDLVSKGTTKHGSALPEKGLKDVLPNGSWLEQKQIQAALEARKNVVEVERIEKKGTLSHAEWREDLLLAEVTQQIGGYWQFMGHIKEGITYLLPEEALYLMEVNCLLLRHNGVLVSLQKAYSLLLRDEKSLMKYRVYASLYRIGYKVFRHECDREKQIEVSNGSVAIRNEDRDENGEKQEQNDKAGVEIETSNGIEVSKDNNEDSVRIKKEVDEEIAVDIKVERLDDDTDVNNSIDDAATPSEKTNTTEAITDTPQNQKENGRQEEQRTVTEENREDIAVSNIDHNNHNIKRNSNPAESEQNDSTNMGNNFEELETSSNVCLHYSTDEDSENEEYSHTKNKIDKLKAQQIQNGSSKNTHSYFKHLPDFAENTIVTVKMPDKILVPNNIASSNCTTTYVMNLQNIRSKPRPVVNNSASYSPNEEVNGPHVKRVRQTSNDELIPDTPLYANLNFPQGPRPRPQFYFWKARPSNPYFNNYVNNPFMMFQRQFTQNMYYQSFFNRFTNPRFNWRNQSITQQNDNWSYQNNRKRKRGQDIKIKHLTVIKNLAARLKHLIQNGNYDVQNIRALRRLIQTFNFKYKTNLYLTNSMDIIEEQNIVDTITLDEDDETQKKRAKIDESYNDNLELLKQLAEKFKTLAKNIPALSHKRALSNAVKTFNKCYKAELYIDDDFNICDPSFINLDSDSDNDCVIQDKDDQPKFKYKLLLNPLSFRKNQPRTESPSTSNSEVNNVENKDYNESFRSVNKYWLPNEDDFGRAEVLPINQTNKRLIDTQKEQFIYEFMKNCTNDFEDWLTLKIAFWESVNEVPRIADDVFKMDQDDCDVKPLISPGENTDLESVLDRLRIIKNCQDSTGETKLAIDFDVYERDLKIFKKSNPPMPHFRIMCFSDASSLPCGDDIAALHSSYKEDVPIILAIVSQASVSYVKVNPVEIPVYLPGSDINEMGL